MARTIRRSRLKPGRKVRDGEHQYHAAGCAHHNLCAYCRGNRTHSSKRRAPVEETP